MTTRMMIRRFVFLCGVGILLAVVLCVSGCTDTKNASPLQPEWQTECSATCSNGYQIRWTDLFEAPKGEGLARELEEQCISDLAKAGCTWPICECTAQERR